MKIRTDAAPAVRRLGAVAVIVVLVSLRSAGPAEGQILNTLRGWPASAPGWAGSLSAAGSLTGGNTREATIEGSARIQYVAAAERFRFSFSSSRKDADGRKNKDEVVVHLRHNHHFPGRLSTVSFLQGQRNPFQRLKDRYLVGAGLAVELLRRERGDLSVGATGMLEYEKLRGEDGFDQVTRLSAFLSGEVPIAEKAALEATLFFQPRFDDAEDFRSLAVAALRVDLNSHFALTWGGKLAYDARPPETVEKEDWDLNAGVRVTL